MAILSNRCKHGTVRTGRHRDDGARVRAIVLDELDPDFLLLPQFKMTID